MKLLFFVPLLAVITFWTQEVESSCIFNPSPPRRGGRVQRKAQTGVFGGKVCHGTRNGLSMSGDAARRYRDLRIRYTGCEKLIGNLEIVFLDDPTVAYDLSFLSTIREITGYVVILSVFGTIIPLDNLEVIKGESLLRIRGRGFALLVGMNYNKNSPQQGLKELHMPRLREISLGDVNFIANPRLCYVNTIPWSDLLMGGRVWTRDDSFSTSCPPCDSSCGNSTCWGPGTRFCYQGSSAREYCEVDGFVVPIGESRTRTPDCRTFSCSRAGMQICAGGLDAGVFQPPPGCIAVQRGCEVFIVQEEDEMTEC